MDKDTISNYGWIIVTVLIGVVILAMATPLGNFVFANIQNSTLEGIKQTNLGHQQQEEQVVKSKERKELVFETKGGKFTGGYMTSYQPGTIVYLPTNIVKENYEFGGWYKNSACTGEAVDTIGKYENQNLVYYAKWIGKQYLIAYNLDGGVFTAPVDVKYHYTYGKPLNLPTGTTNGAVSKEGYVFDGWYNSKTNKLVKNTDKISGNITLYAHWKLQT